MSKLAYFPKMAKKAIFSNFDVSKLTLKMTCQTSTALSTGLSTLADQILRLDMAKWRVMDSNLKLFLIFGRQFYVSPANFWGLKGQKSNFDKAFELTISQISALKWL